MQRSGDVRTVVLFGVAGVVVNLLVAAGCALWSPMKVAGRLRDPVPAREMVEWRRWNPPRESERTTADWHTFEYQGFGVQLVEMVVTERALLSLVMFRPTRGKLILYAGWPFRTLAADALVDDGQGLVATQPPPYWTPAWRDPRVDSVAVVSGGVPTLDWDSYVNQLVSSRRPLPLGIERRGIVLGSVFWGVALFVLVSLPRRVRERRRRSRSECVKCGYPVGASSTCCECGAAVVRMTRFQQETVVRTESA